ncbi:MAG: site-2 protease family protein, partial [Chloroflexi bacterium]|nr:site-2 protease family protein [Chloroflexota bacterium]
FFTLFLQELFRDLLFINLGLMAFNLLPIAPLDGFKIALGILPRGLAEPFSRLERYGPIILLSLILFDFVFERISIIGTIVSPVLEFLRRFVLGL